MAEDHRSQGSSAGSNASCASSNLGSETTEGRWFADVAQVANCVAEMLIIDPEVLRVTPAHVALQGFGRAFRPCEQTLYHKSQRSGEIERFWSHSWHGDWWAKVLTLCMLYNGLASASLGTLAALVMMVPFSTGVLPGFARMEDHTSVWSILTGLLVSTAVFTQWRPRQTVFFDRICINEEDPNLKGKAILSLAGMLKQSKEMLVLWDPSWSTRLWCLFELAAFLKCKKAQHEQVLIVRPTYVGPSSIAVFLTALAGMVAALTFPVSRGTVWERAMLLPMLSVLGCSAVAGVAAFVYLRRYFNSINTFEEKLRSCSFHEVTSSCCQMNHLTKDGRPMPCDREVVMRCVASWFGSIEAFEESIKAEVLEVVAGELREGVFTWKWALQVTAPVLWGFLDLTATHLRYGLWDTSFFFAGSGLVLWLLCAPLLVEVATFLIRRFCSRSTCCSRSGVLSQVASFLMIALVCSLMLAALALPVVLIPHKPGGFSAYLWPFVFGGGVLLIALMLSVMKRLLGKPELRRPDGSI